MIRKNASDAESALSAAHKFGEHSLEPDHPGFSGKNDGIYAGVLKNKQGKTLFINFISDISPACDCLPYNDAPIVRDIGIAASTDPVALDQASADLVNAEAALPGCCLKHNLLPGEDKFKGLYPQVPWELQLSYGETIGLGSRKYTLKRLETLSWDK